MNWKDASETTFGALIEAGLLSVTDGYRAKNSELGGNGVIFLRAGHVTDTHIDLAEVDRFREELTPRLADKLSQPGDVAVTTKGNSTGRTTFVTPDMPQFVYSPHLSRWRSLDEKRLVAGFLRYWSRSREFTVQLKGMAASTDMAPYLSLRDQHRLRITLPPPEVQRAIGSVLGSLDDKIDHNRRTSETLERLARSIFRAWFVDFEPVKAKAAGERSFPGMPPEVFDRLPERLVDSDIGPVPQGWGVGRVGDTADISRETVKPQEYLAEEFDHFSIPAFDEARQATVEAGSAIKSNKSLVVPGCVLVSKLNPRIPRVWLPPAAGTRRQIASTEFLVVVLRTGWHREYLYCQFCQDHFRDSLAQSASGTSNSHQRIRPEDLLAKSVVLPPATARAAFQSTAEPMMALSATLQAESRKLAELRDYLLPKLVSGAVRVRPDGPVSVTV